eukprot:CAMPEP_0204579452 /NCGR_PEP_ID=MMETSP0661-20131031/43489_1 /ASSEMBLY_ACC=CAM_ASM_000606 /TAXON_ID=109239 /ORGANISM="Alexandrium margalefi, Strain AMGDE01CS-322" /LENGTH=571 /DNA_ID=CAMNT_0051588461 /DNA_START=92 /DNA_END=1807 /DNA_ORIENTATION=+
MALRFAVLAAFIILAVDMTPTEAKGFLMHDSKHRKTDASAFDNEIQTAMGEAMGCGGEMSRERLLAIESALTPAWKALPKNSYGRIERRSLRYLAHRYFTQRSSLWIRGFEPTRPVNHSAWGSEDILSQRVPAFVESVLESSHAQVKGFDLKDAVRMVATLEQLIFDSESALLEQAYRNQRKVTTRSLGTSGVAQVLEEYMVRWMMGDDQESVKILLSNQSLLGEHVPHWDKIVKYVRGEVALLDFQRQRTPAKLSRPGHNALSQRYSYEDAHHVVGGITSSFASFWQSECSDMKLSLVGMDPGNTGRVPLSKFYSSGLDSEWRFGESESYLRDLGALDETSSRGKQVIISNYIQGASNCIISSSHYLVCCVNECEAMLGEIEKAIGSPLALPSEILPLVGNMTSQTTIDHDDPPQLEGALTQQLEQIAATHGGKVPLHGRLFAQWLHYAFPHECVFPHMTGTAATSTPMEYGDNYIASKDEMKQHARSKDTFIDAKVDKEELQWMSQWSDEEELVGSYSELQESFLSRHLLSISGGLILVLGLFGILSLGRGGAAAEASVLSNDGKTHFV